MENREMICINCPLGCMLTVSRGEDGAVSVTGNTCPRGEEYGRTELTDPRRTVTSTVRVKGKKDRAVPVKTAFPIPKGKIMECMKELKETEINLPAAVGDVVLEDVAGTGVAVVVTRNIS